jgi:hypothetical protein
MEKEDSDVPAWLLCEDILSKLKTELITEAMDTLQEAIDSKAIEISGSLVSLPDKPSDTEMNMFIINRLMEQRESIIDMYKDQLQNVDAQKDPKKVEQLERLRKFLMAVDQIFNLITYSRLFDPWMNDAGMQAAVKEPSEVLKNTMKGSEERTEVLNYILKSKKIEKEEVLTKKERKIIEDSLAS